MIPATIHFRGVGTEQRELRSLPDRGHYVSGPGDRLYVVSQVVFIGKTIRVYAVQVSEAAAAALEKSWAEWSNPPAESE